MWSACLRLFSTITCLIPIVTLIAVDAVAVPAELVDDLRKVGSYGDDCFEDFESGYTCTHFDNEYTPDTPFQDWIRAGQQSSVSTLEMSAEGAGSGFSDLGWSSSFSTFNIVFDIPAPTEITLGGELYVERWANASVELIGAGGTLFERLHDMDGTVPFSEVLILDAGRYQIRAGASGTADPFGTYATYSLNVGLSPTAVPEPGTALLVGLGIVGIAMQRAQVRAPRP